MRTGLGLGEPGVVGGRGGPRLLGRTLLVSARAWGGVMGGGLWGSCSRPSQPELPMSHQAHLVQQKSTPWEQTIMNKILQKLLRTCEAFLEPIHPFHSTNGPGQFQIPDPIKCVLGPGDVLPVFYVQYFTDLFTILKMFHKLSLMLQKLIVHTFPSIWH